MSAHRARGAGRALFSVAVIASLAGCYRHSAPPGWLPRPEEARRGFGSWIEIQDRPGTPTQAVAGELLAIDADTVHVLADGRLVSLPRTSLCCVTVTAFRMDYSPLQLWAAIGTLSTASHGFGLILTGPVWLLTGTLAASAASYAPRIRSTDPAVLRPFARFPQGIPPGLDRATLRSKPWRMPGEPALPQ
ncbi:MAG: hypothetical protein M3303_01830 [Gemmatimonadota bacterium]|nr:hypothetical protein [Gemmatimonadota bacterium]